MTTPKKKLTFAGLVDSIKEVDFQLAQQAIKAVNMSLTKHGVSRCDRREIYHYRRLYLIYPQIVEAVTPQLKQLLPASRKVSSKVGTVSPQFTVPPEMIVTHLSYNMIELLTGLVHSGAEPTEPKLKGDDILRSQLVTSNRKVKPV
jgi:hypothetical protein